MMQAVQPFVNTSISKTVNIPADYPYNDFKNLYHHAWKAGLKGLATYRPNNILGVVLKTPAASKTQDNAQPATQADAAMQADLMRAVIESRPKGALNAVAGKIEYWTQEGKNHLLMFFN